VEGVVSALPIASLLAFSSKLNTGWGAEKVRKVVQALEGEQRRKKAEEEAQVKARQEDEEAEFWRSYTTFMATYRPTRQIGCLIL
jgi:hypothetical protein